MRSQLYQKMKYMLDCGFNLLVYGVGSKVDILNYFVQKQLIMQCCDVIIFNGFHSGCNMKKVVDEITGWFLKIVYLG